MPSPTPDRAILAVHLLALEGCLSATPDAPRLPAHTVATALEWIRLTPRGDRLTALPGRLRYQWVCWDGTAASLLARLSAIIADTVRFDGLPRLMRALVDDLDGGTLGADISEAVAWVRSQPDDWTITPAHAATVGWYIPERGAA